MSARVIAAMLRAAASWLEDELAAGTPPKYLVGQAVTATRDMAWLVRAVDEGKVPW